MVDPDWRRYPEAHNSIGWRRGLGKNWHGSGTLERGLWKVPHSRHDGGRKARREGLR
jgi:hypothetical protein